MKPYLTPIAVPFFTLAVILVILWLVRGTMRASTAAQRGPREEIDGIDLAAMIEAIADVESGNDPQAIGKAGERGRCQFTEATWQAHTDAPWLLWAPTRSGLTAKVELAHLRWVCGQLREHGHALDPALIAAAWRVGVRHAAACLRTDAAQRTANLYWDTMGRRAAGEAIK